MKIKTDYVPRSNGYLSEDTEYIVSPHDDFGGFIEDNNGDIIRVSFKNCYHLKGHNWEILKNEYRPDGSKMEIPLLQCAI